MCVSPSDKLGFDSSLIISQTKSRLEQSSTEVNKVTPKNVGVTENICLLTRMEVKI